MAGANSNIQLSTLDFNDIKNNLKLFLQSQDAFKDYNFEGSGLSVLLDIMAYNTQYNAYYLNQVANEMFLDSATQRSSVVSHAKLLNYTPKSYIAPTATVNINFTGVTDSQLVLPAYTNFSSEAIDGINYNFVTTDDYYATTSDGTATYTDVELKQGVIGNFNYVVDSSTNPSYTFEIPDANIDTTTIKVVVQQSSSNTSMDTYSLSRDVLYLNGESKVFFLQEALNGNYEIIFGDGIIGKKLADGNIVRISYLSTEGTSGAGANNFVLMDNIGSYTSSVVTGVTAATNGSNKETIDSIKYQAPKYYSSQGRAVTKEDYISALQQNTLGVSFDAVNVWGGEENSSPVYGQVFICLKPSGSYSLTDTQKQRLINDVIKPISVMTVTPTIVDPDYTYIKLNVNVLYDPKKTTLTSGQIENKIVSAISTFGDNTLNTFNSTFSLAQLIQYIQESDSSIITNEVSLQLEKKFYPILTNSQSYNIQFNTPLEKGTLLSGISSSPSMSFRDPTTPSNIITGVYLEEVPTVTGGVSGFHVLNAGFGYQYAPKVTILGDGEGATAQAYINSKGQISKIELLTPGSGYTSASVKITNALNDTEGKLATIVPILEGQYGTLRTYYFNSESVKTILNSNVGTIDYTKGLVTLNSFNPLNIDNPLGQLAITATPKTTIVSSTYNGIITIDSFDPAAITVNVTAKTQ